MSSPAYDALLIVSFGGPEGPEEVMPFLENVLRGKNVPRERMSAVAEHYQKFGGVSPINAQNRALIAALREELDAHGPRWPIYFGNRNWRPMLADTLRQMAADGIRHAAAFFTSAYSSYSGCRQYRENIAAAQAEVGPGAPQVDKLRVFFNHPGFIEPMIERVATAFERIPAERRDAAGLVFTAHSIPLAMAQGCRYEQQLREASRLVAAGVGRSEWDLAYQSRSGPPSQPWLVPDIGAWLERAHAAGMRDVVVAPIGFISDHLEVIYDLDYEAQERCAGVGLNMERAATVGTHPRFVCMIRELLIERMTPGAPRPAVGNFGPSHEVCPVDCCLPAARRWIPGGPNEPIEVLACLVGMSNYIPNNQKKNRIFAKRERQLVLAIKNNLPAEKITQAAEKLREAKINVFKLRFGFNKSTGLHSRCKTPEAAAANYVQIRRWLAMTTVDLVEMYRPKESSGA